MKNEKEVEERLKEIQTTLDGLRVSDLHKNEKVFLMGEEYALKWVLGKKVSKE
jgi:hypothetical protein